MFRKEGDPNIILIRPTINVSFKCECGEQATFIVTGAETLFDKRGRKNGNYAVAEFPERIASSGRIAVCDAHLLKVIASIQLCLA